MSMTKEYTFIIKKLEKVVAIIITIFLIGTLGFHIIEKISLLDSFYMTVITISTVGYREERNFLIMARYLTLFLS